MALAPKYRLAQKTLPAGLLKAIIHIFGQGINEIVLVGGTALAGFYAGHRKSDDIDIFVGNLSAMKATIAAVDSLTEIGGIKLKQGQKTPQYYNALFEINRHQFTIDVVLDENFIRIAQPHLVQSISVASLQDILRMKMATIVSRCSEKDLYDLKWLFEHAFLDLSLTDKFALGDEIDAGLDFESALTSLANAVLRVRACGFAIDHGTSSDTVYNEIEAFRVKLAKDIIRELKKHPKPSALAEVISRIKALKD
jgi:Nucleotidyl transferase AbiEii toxin, Type IV TA system